MAYHDKNEAKRFLKLCRKLASKYDKFYLVKSTMFSYRTHDIDLMPKIHKIWNSKLWDIPEISKNNKVQIVGFPDIDYRLRLSEMKE
jgi:hypothetical protein